MPEIEYVLAVLRRRFVVVLVVVAAGFFAIPIVLRSVHPSYEATARILVVNETGKDTTLTSSDLPSIIQSTEVLERVKNQLKLDDAVPDLRKSLSARAPLRSSIVQISFRDRDPQRAVAIPNAVADATSTYFHEIATRRYEEVTKYLTTSIDEQRMKIAAANERLQKATAAHSFSSSDKALDSLTARIDELQTLRGQAAASVVADAAQAGALAAQRRKISGIVRHEVLERDPVYQKIQTGVAKDTAQLISDRSAFTDNYPGLAGLEETVNREQAELKDAERTALRDHIGASPSYVQTVLDERKALGVVAGDRARVNALSAQISEAQDRLRELSGPGATAGTLRAERDGAVQSYLALATRLSTAQADAAQAASLGSLVVVDRAVPGAARAWFLSPYLSVILAILVAAAAVVAAFIVESLDPRLSRARDIEGLYGRPVYATIGRRSR